MTLKDDLIAAKALIDTPEKWIKDRFHSDCGHCAVGAVWTVCGANNKSSDAIRLLQGIIPHRFGSVSSFNDHPDTTHADIMALFDRAIAAADEHAPRGRGAEQGSEMTETVKDGGPAFPCEDLVRRDENGKLCGAPISSTGMTLRDWFAGQALGGILSGGFADTIPHDDVTGGQDAAFFAYQYADAMLAERSKAGGSHEE